MTRTHGGAISMFLLDRSRGVSLTANDDFILGTEAAPLASDWLTYPTSVLLPKDRSACMKSMSC